MSAAQFVCVLACVSVMAAPWAAWLLDEPLRSPYVVATVATAVLVGTLAGLYHQGQVAMARARRPNARGPFIERDF